MLSIVEKRKLYTIQRFLFNDVSNQIQSKYTISNFFNSYIPANNLISSFSIPGYTVVTDLLLDTEDIFSKIKSKTYKYEIRRALKEKTNIKVIDSSFIMSNPVILDYFERRYKEYCMKFNLHEISGYFNKGRAEELVKINAFTITVAEFEGGSVFHVYYHENCRAILIHSISDYREDNTNKALAGRMNKLLHYKDMLYFKNKQYSLYDWGGIRNPQNPNGIDKFKLEFGGNLIKKYNIFVGNNMRGKLLVTLFKIKNKYDQILLKI